MEWWDILSRTLASEFSDIPDLEHGVRVAVRLLLAAVLGGVLGYFLVERLEFQPAPRDKIQSGNAGRDPLGERERVRDRRPHVRISQLCEKRTIDVFDERMDDALRMHDDVDGLWRDAEQSMRFDDFKSLVHHRSGVDRDLATHCPVRMRTSLLGCDVFEDRYWTCA